MAEQVLWLVVKGFGHISGGHTGRFGGFVTLQVVRIVGTVVLEWF